MVSFDKPKKNKMESENEGYDNNQESETVLKLE